MNGKKGMFNLTINVTANEDYDERSASIIIACDDIRRTIVVTQKQHDALLLSPGRVEMPCTGGRFTIEVKANIDYKETVPDDYSWLHAVATTFQ